MRSVARGLRRALQARPLASAAQAAAPLAVSLAQPAEPAAAPWSGARWAAAALAAAALGGAASCDAATPAPPAAGGNLLSREQRVLLFYNYERKLRQHSEADKLFAYFASLHRDGAQRMAPLDFLRATVPVFPAYGSTALRSGALPGEPRVQSRPRTLPPAAAKFFTAYRGDSEGALSFADFLLFSTLLTIPAGAVDAAFRMFDVDENGSLDSKEFAAMMRVLRASTRLGAGTRAGAPARTGSEAVSEESLDAAALSSGFFTRGRVLTHAQFRTFMEGLSSAMAALEFAHYDSDRDGLMSPADFGLSLIAGVPSKQLPAFLERVARLPQQADAARHVTLAQFSAFQSILPQLSRLRTAVEAFDRHRGELSRASLERAVRRVCGVSLAPTVLDVLLSVFDADGDGRLSTAEFFDVLQAKETNMARSNGAGGGLGSAASGFLSCCSGCAADAWASLSASSAA